MADIRVTQAGRSAVTQEDADVRVTQAGRSAVTQEAADVRVTQAGRFAAAQDYGGDLRVTMLGRFVLAVSPKPSRPILITPVSGGVYDTSLAVQWQASTDPLSRPIVYNARYKPIASGTWTDIFVSKATVETVLQDISGDTDGTYDFEMWAVTDDTDAAESPKNAFTITIHNGKPSAPNITSPYEGEKWQQTTNSLEWDASIDPQDDPLTYSGRYRAVGASSWNTLFTAQSALTYSWNTTALAVDDYEVEVWANDGTGDGDHAVRYFSIFIADEPLAPRIRIIELGADYVVAELEEYSHPFSRAWQATKWELIPFGGSWTNPVVSYTTTDSTEQLQYRFENLPPGFFGEVRATFQDNVNTWGDPSTPAAFQIPAQTTDWVRTWERNAGWGAGGGGLRGTAGDWPSTGYWEQPLSAVIDPAAEPIGSFYLEGRMMAGGCYCGFIGRDTELQAGGIGVSLGNSETGGEVGLFFGIDYGISAGGSGITGSHTSSPYLFVQFEDDVGCTAYGVGRNKTVYGSSFIAYSQVTEGVQPQFGQPIGPWVSPFTHYPWYKLEVWCQRNLATATTRVRARINYEGYVQNFDPSLINQKRTAEDEWDIDFTFPCITPCAAPGFWRRQWAYAWESSYIEYRGLKYTALRDEGLEYVVTREPLNPYTEAIPETCTPVVEAALPTPVFFPLPPNGNVGEDWVHPSDLLTARDDTEQRISLREKEVQRISYTVTVPSSREVTHLRALLWENQPGRWVVPMWMDNSTLLTNLASLSGSIPAGYVDTDGHRFEEMEYVALWQDQFTWEVFEASLNPDGSITLVGTTGQLFEAHKTQVIPCRVGRMEKEVEYDHLSPSMGDMDFIFVLEATDNG